MLFVLFAVTQVNGASLRSIRGSVAADAAELSMLQAGERSVSL